MPSTFDTGNTGFMLVATSLVMLMTPGLAFFYGGLVSRKNVLAIMIQSFVSMGVTTVVWFAFGYSLCFSGGEGGVIGNLDRSSCASRTLCWRCRRFVFGALLPDQCGKHRQRPHAAGKVITVLQTSGRTRPSFSWRRLR